MELTDFFIVLLATCQGVSTLSVSKSNISGYELLAASVECFYNVRSSNFVKYWCREDKLGNCEILRKTSEPPTTGDKIVISDDQTHGVFTVTINRLEMSDSGVYRCGIENPGHSVNAVVRLAVLKGASTLSAKERHTLEFVRHPISMQCTYYLGYSSFIKYWCKGDSQGNCEILCKTNTPQKNGDRIIISDNQTHGVLTLTINKVERSDVGTYWCGIEKLGLNAKASVTLKVLKGFYAWNDFPFE
ncbi:CMRF35-like molecule 7 [Erpetoichthys calabaricus]|uniref:CMRF35-like molecule 7 n=1 Tax=Erpetoichthys calabaricus TaxID=27687 RepID=UPI0010A049B2|nr:CMRF35-like molecule 7 [Erpetoichthys calabaricus]